MRIILTVLVVWACSCGIKGQVPWWVAVQTADARNATLHDQCAVYQSQVNKYNVRNHNPVLAVGGNDRLADSEGLIRWCEFLIVNGATGGFGCYRFAIDTSGRVWSKVWNVPCNHPWARLSKQRLQPVAFTA